MSPERKKHSGTATETQRLPQGYRKGSRTMNEKTMRQIEAIKNQTIGVEIEMLF